MGAFPAPHHFLSDIKMGIIRYKTKNAEVVDIFADDVKDAIARFKKGE
jgi:hypothetical protein